MEKENGIRNDQYQEINVEFIEKKLVIKIYEKVANKNAGNCKKIEIETKIFDCQMLRK